MQNGIALVKLMGRHAGFPTAETTVASQDVNFTLVPEVAFQLEGQGGFLAALERRIVSRGHAVIAVAEGAGQELLGNAGTERDASGNVKLSDFGAFLNKRIEEWFQARNIPCVMRYFDPSYIVRSSPDNAEDTILAQIDRRRARVDYLYPLAVCAPLIGLNITSLRTISPQAEVVHASPSNDRAIGGNRRRLDETK